jgi:hypothetical protein
MSSSKADSANKVLDGSVSLAYKKVDVKGRIWVKGYIENLRLLC